MGKEAKAKRDDKNVIIKSKPLKALIWVGVIVFLFFLIMGLLHTAGILQRSMTAVTVGDVKVSALDYNIYYVDARSNFINTNYSFLSQLGYPTDSRLDSMELGEGTTWGDTFKDSAVNRIQETMTLCQEAEAAGFAMTEKAKEQLRDYMEGFNDIPTQTDMTVDSYLKLAFGNSTKLADIERVYERIFYASAWQQHKYDTEYIISDDQVETYYQENKTTYDIASYYNHAFDYTTYTYTAPAEGESVAEGQPASEEEATRMSEESKAQAQAYADELLAQVMNDGQFDLRAGEMYYAIHEGEEDVADYNSALVMNGSISGTDAVAEWIKDEARVEGEKTTIDTGSSINVVLFLSRERNESKVASVRHILIKTTEITEEMTAEEKAEAEAANEEAKAKVESIYAQWQAGEMTEDSFAELAMEHNEDTGSQSNGGLYSDFSEGSMVPSFNDWSFDEARQEGDHTIVETDYGYHIMYMVSPGEVAYIRNIRTTLQNEQYTGYIDAAKEKYAMKTSALGLKICF